MNFFYLSKCVRIDFYKIIKTLACSIAWLYDSILSFSLKRAIVPSLLSNSSSTTSKSFFLSLYSFFVTQKSLTTFASLAIFFYAAHYLIWHIFSSFLLFRLFILINVYHYIYEHYNFYRMFQLLNNKLYSHQYRLD